MNHKKATPAKGIRFSAIVTVPDSVAIQAPESRGSSGTERRSSQSIAIRRTEKAMPAIAAAFGVFSCFRVRTKFSDITRLHIRKLKAMRSTSLESIQSQSIGLYAPAHRSGSHFVTMPRLLFPE